MRNARTAFPARCAEIGKECAEFARITRGLAAILEKGKKFESLVEEFHSVSISDPLVADNSFACTMQMDVTMKSQGRMNLRELCVYEVRDGKIVSESFHF